MALYTATLEEWIGGGGELPPSFEQIEGFAQAFIYRFIDREIGFETPYLFQAKLNGKALEVMPDLIAQADALKKESLDLPTRSSKTKTSIGKRRSTASDWPANPGTDEPSPTSVAVSDEAGDSSETTSSGLTEDEQVKRFAWLREAKASLIKEGLNRFEPLFMEVY